MVNVVLSSLPLYMSFYHIPHGVIQAIDRVRRAFLWEGARDTADGLCIAHWKIVCTPKDEGGLGVLNFCLFNTALLAKWWWRRLSEPSSGWASLVQHNYYRRRSFFEPTSSIPGYVSSF